MKLQWSDTALEFQKHDKNNDKVNFDIRPKLDDSCMEHELHQQSYNNGGVMVVVAT